MPLHLTRIEPVAALPSPVGMEEGFPVEYGGGLYVVRDGAFESFEQLLVTAASGAALEVDFSLGNLRDITLTDNCVLTFVGLVGVVRSTFILRQDATGSRTVTWPASVIWPGGTPPTLSTAVGAVDLIRLFTPDGGATVFGKAEGLAYA